MRSSYGDAMWVVVLALALAGASAAPTNLSTSTNSSAAHKHTVSDRPVVIPQNEKTNTSGSKPERPGRADKAHPGGEVKQLVEAFQERREVYLSEHEALVKKFRGASAEEREAIREQLRANLERLKEMQRQMVKEQKDRAKDMRNQLQPDLGRVIDAGNSGGGRR